MATVLFKVEGKNVNFIYPIDIRLICFLKKAYGLVSEAERIHCIGSKLPASELSSHPDNASSEEN